MVIIQKRVGQLGNQLFAIAHFAAAAIEHDYKVVYPCFQDSLDHFPKINSNNNLKVFHAGPRLNRLIHRGFKLLRLVIPKSPWHQCYFAEDAPCVDIGSPEFVKKARKKLIACEGGYWLFEDSSSLMKHHHQIIDLFQPNKATENRIQDFINCHHLDRNIVMVGFHIRRSDYRTYRNGEYFYDDAAWKTWIQQARLTFGSSSRRFVGVIFSDEDMSALVGSANDLIISQGNMFDDLCLMSRCHYLLGPPSSFSGWASFVGRVPLLALVNRDVEINRNAFETDRQPGIF